MKYLDSDTMHECRDAIRRGVPLQLIATKLTIDEIALAQLLSWEGLQAEVPGRSPESCDLWACDAMNDIL